MDIVERLEQVFVLEPGAKAIGQRDHWYSYAEVRDLADQIGDIIEAAGLGSGTPCGILLRNRPAHFAASLGVILRRHCVVTINPALPTKPLIEDIEALRVPVIIADEQDWANGDFADAVQRTGAIGIIISTQADNFKVALRSGMDVLRGNGHRANEDGIAIEMLTSGTTGKAKRIKLSADSFSRSLWAGSKYEAVADGKLALKGGVAIQWMPLVHIGGLFQAFYSTYNGRRFVLMERFDLDDWHDLVVQHRPKFGNLPPSFLAEAIARDWPIGDLKSLVAIRTGAAPLDHDIAIQFEERYHVPVLEAYGATEFAGGVAGWTISDYRMYGRDRRRSVGRANSGVELRVVERDTFEPLGPNEEGILEVRSKQMDAGRTWIRTTDLARIDEDGFLYILGRSDSVIIRGGFKVMPGHVEDAITRHEAIREACVVGVKDAKLGEVPVAAIQLHSGVDAPDGDHLKLYLRERLKPYEIPTQFLVVDQLPRTPSLKVSLAEVRALFLVGKEGKPS